MVRIGQISADSPAETNRAPIAPYSGTVTDAPEAPAQLDQTEAAVAAFRRQLEGQVSVSASVVQDVLLDLWGLLPDGDSRTQVERWLTETLERNLYQVADIDARLASVLPARTDRAGPAAGRPTDPRRPQPSAARSASRTTHYRPSATTGPAMPNRCRGRLSAGAARRGPGRSIALRRPPAPGPTRTSPTGPRR